MNEALSIVYSTIRPDPAFAWFADGLARQLTDVEVDLELVVVDGIDGPERAGLFADAIGNRFPLTYTPAKPTVFNGPHQRTARPMFAASSARNTGIVFTTKPYVVFVDDCAVLMPGWLDEALEASRHRYVVAGAYKKHWAMVVSDGELVTSDERVNVDVRWDAGDDRQVVPIEGGQLYGCSLGIPRDVLVDIGGFDEICDGIGGEDYQLGIRLEFAGHRLFYARSMMIVESEEHHRGSGAAVTRVDPELDERSYMSRLAEFGVRQRATTGRLDASHMVLDLLHGLRHVEPIGNHYRLGELNPSDLGDTIDGLPDSFWFDRRAFSDL